MRKLLSTVFPLLAFFNVYLLFAFGEWDINPGNWGKDGRIICAIIGGVSFLLAIRLSLIIDEKNESKR